jgi:hypothetical protein
MKFGGGIEDGLGVRGCGVRGLGLCQAVLAGAFGCDSAHSRLR